LIRSASGRDIRDSLGNIATGTALAFVRCPQILRPDDLIDFVVTASDPNGAPLQYAMEEPDRRWPVLWQENNTFSIRILESHIGTSTQFGFFIKGARPHHASRDCDDDSRFVYTVLPKKT
jgi:hypothetical protein